LEISDDLKLLRLGQLPDDEKFRVLVWLGPLVLETFGTKEAKLVMSLLPKIKN